ncbi:nicotinate-nucleotide adenylyltransferase [candidate division NPL-UPA2 bacterium Unc8]|uniref:Probable nicotinate-nucleotide adenylyltransferase n=1 Tax=candidate division NPL-UPA2 bacterium Unc8 TaxID=1980939 RepID=A0A399FVE5_UNCN2|nr:putative nicotinate-nucleotide adenylyltransferase [Bacillota bacterium]MBT9138216.1 putative nicotinate-nucleotide adenylyltransferase [Bacillota bacterium]MBT9146673.1 putative nicotinate-nucleotide adenylyltransferase [Bacillota bacterium]RII00378.1 MAG: nicotinate-nucleotide adenylyltransferase [candidate division NPL-UPA2 bacterium Unc8]
MRIGIMGGTFNPIHYGHLVVAAEAGDQFKLDNIVFIPSGTPPHKDSSDIAPAKARYEMTRLATRSNPLFSISSLEIERGGKSYSVETVERLLAAYGKEAQIYFIVGVDSMLEIESWKNVDELLKLCEFIVALRPGFNVEEINPAVRKRSHIMKIPEIGISATDVRKRIKEGKSIRYLVTLEVEEYIRRYSLYTEKEGESCQKKKKKVKWRKWSEELTTFPLCLRLAVQYLPR